MVRIWIASLIEDMLLNVKAHAFECRMSQVQSPVSGPLAEGLEKSNSQRSQQW